MNKLTEHLTLPRILTVALASAAIYFAIEGTIERVANVSKDMSAYRQGLPPDQFERDGLKVSTP